MKLKNLMGAFLALAGLASGGSASGGNVWEFIHDSPKSMSYSAGEEITFRMRLLSPNYEEEKEDRLTWSKWPNMDNVTVQSYFLKDPTHAAEYLNADYPLAIGVVANGKTYGAVFQGSNPANDNLATDFTFRYAVKCGDYALPLRLAANGNGLPVGAGQWSADAAEDSTHYYFLNGPGDANDIWTITTSNGDVFDRQLVTGTEAAKNIMKREETFVGDGTYLKSFAYSLETLEYDDETAKGDDDNDYWRVVRGSTAEPKDATMRTADGLEPVDAGIVVYAWIAPGGGEDEDPTTWDWASDGYAVSIPLDGGKHVSQETFFDPDQDMTSDTPRKHNVYTFRIAPPTKSYSLPLKGVVVGKTARVILSSTKHWDYTSAGVLEEDFRFKTVFCGEQQPTLSVSVDNYDNPATFPDANHELTDYTRAERLRVRLEGVETHAALTVKLAFELGDSPAFPTNIIAISKSKEAGFDAKNLLPGLEVTIPENKPEPDEPIWLFVLGATKETATPPGIGIRPVPDASFATPIPNTNALRVIIRGMNPVATAVNDVDIVDGEPTVLSAIRDGQLDLRVRVEDSYRNLALLDAGGTNGFYTVTFDRGYSKAMTITNNAAGGPLVPVDYFSDGYAYLNFTVPYTSQTNDYAATFKLMNPDGLESKTYSLTVPVREGYSVSASAPDGRETEDGFFELMESDTDRYRINFQLSDILGADGANLWAFLEPANETASNRTDGAFFTVRKDGTAGTGVPVNTLSSGKGSTGIDYTLGGIQILDGDGKGDGSGNTAQYNVILCTQQEYDADKVFTVYDGSTRKFTLILDNHRPEFKQLVLREDGKATPVDSSITNGETVATAVRLNKAITVEPHKTKGWSDVDLDLTATDDKQVVVRWRVYELDDDGGSPELYDVFYTFGTEQPLQIEDGFSRIGRKRVIAQIQDKDMRATNTVQWVEDEERWAYYVDPEYGVEGDSETWDADDEEINWWGPEMSFVFRVSENPRIFVSADGFAETAADGQPIFSESQLFPHSGANDTTMKFNVELEEGIKSTWVTVRVEVAVAPNTTAKDGYITLGATNLAFYGTSKLTAAVPIADFDATYRDGMKNPAKWVVTATIDGISKGDVPKYDNTPYVFYLQNVGPKLELAPDGDSQQYSDYVDSELVYELAKDDIVDLSWLARDIRPDLTNISVTATISGGKIIADDRTEVLTYTRVSTNAAEVVTNQENFAYSAPFSFKFSNMGTNKIVFVAKDKDGDTSEKHTIRFFVPTTKTLLLYPSKPTTPSTDSNDIADYFSAAGIGYGHVWADGETSLSSISKWIHNWTCSESGVVMAYAMGYLANEREDRDKSLAFVNEDGNHGTGTGYYAPSAKSGYDSFFYRWFAKTQSNSSTDKSNWTAYKPVPQVSTNQATAAAGSAISLSFPKKTGSQDTEYNDISALAVFSRELLTSDNMGDINADGVPDSFVVKYKLVEEFAGGNDLNDVNYTEDGSTPYCLDYLPQTLTVRYSQLIPELTEVSNIENAEAFTPRLKIRGYDETDVQSLAKRRAVYGATAEIIPGISALNDAAALAGIDGAAPSRKYVNPREDADSTLNYVEWLAWSEYAAANGYDPADAAKWSTWSPERPTDPMKADFDNDGFTDGYEYYVWYRAHVGWIDEAGIHRYLTGRAYDSRNPGEGQFISSERIVELFDPRAKGAADNTQDTDNDGLPDLLEFEIGTNPFDFDTDGDGLPDGFELIVAGTDPLTDHTAKDAKHDAERNYDGDAMAITSYALEQKQKPVPVDIEHAKFTTFALIDPSDPAYGDTDGVQWYATKAEVALETNMQEEAVWSFRLAGDDRDYLSYTEPKRTSDGHLAVMLEKGAGESGTYISTEPTEVEEPVFDEDGNPVIVQIPALDEDGNPVLDPDSGEPVMVDVQQTNRYTVAGALYPVRVPAGVVVESVSEGKISIAFTTLAADIAAKDANACWIYGKGPQNVLYGEVAETAADYGCLALGRHLEAKKGRQVVVLPDDTRDVAFLHYLVYQEFGFDPRTAWSSSDPVHPRWGKTTSGGEAVQGVTVMKQGGYAGTPARTRDYRAYDEFLVYSFFLNNGCDMTDFPTADEKAPDLAKVWMAFCTNPRGVGEPVWASDEHYKGWTAERDENGADTDGDGVPDGWELYIMAGPKYNGDFVFAPPYAGFVTALAHDAKGEYRTEKSYWSPFLDYSDKPETNNQLYLGGQANDDGLNEFQEFEGTDSTGWYADVQTGNTLPYSTTVVHGAEGWKWLNKFFPSDPWAVDTDGDGVKDNEEKGAFIYGTPADDGKLWSIPGGGLNPCSVDTDLDGLPDGWELQFKPMNYANVYAGEFADYAKDATGAAVGNPLQGLTDGMDGTVKDAFSYPVEYADNQAGGTNVTTYVIADGFRQVVNRDYDRDGLENWQEYLTGTMRCWRYDDPLSSWSYIPRELYYTLDKDGSWLWNPDYAGLNARFGKVIDTSAPDKGAAEFWYRTLVDKASPIYNPGLVTDVSHANYFSRVTNAWDCAYLDADLSGKNPGAYYWFKERIGDQPLTELWKAGLGLVAGDDTGASGLNKYPSCSPIEPDSDFDGMDDYYELFHGLNPLLGESGRRLADKHPCDLVYDSWSGEGGDSFSAWGGPDGRRPNFWQLDPGKTAQAAKREGSNGYDFEVYPWLNGLADADPDGDIMPNQEEALWPELAKVTFHTDPSPLWMTDTSYTNSIVRRFFRLPARFENAWPNGETFTFKDTAYSFAAFGNWVPAKGMVPAHFGPYVPDFWSLAASGEMNWMYSFEENEGYDSDHDGISDFEEKEGRFRSATDPQDADSPRRRQAMYFQGPSNPSALQTMPFVDERYPTQKGYPDELAFAQFSVECWVKPESLAESIILERAVWTGLSSPADAEYMRKNFQLGIRTGSDGRSYWFAKYDPVGTADETHEVVALSKSPATAEKWTHLAATYDGAKFILYVNGKENRTEESGLPPSWGAGVIAHTDTQNYWFDREYALNAIIIGAGAKTQAQGAPDGFALDVTQGLGFDRYTGFFTGWIDEVRVWDGARTAEEVANEWNVRYTAELAAKNRSAFYDEWKAGKRRYEKDGSGKDVSVLAELRFHWSFDSIFGAQNETALAVAPHAFDGLRATLSRPADYSIAWWENVLSGYGSLYDFGRADWISWIPNTVAHLPRFDGTTLDSVYRCEDFRGAEAGTYRFPRTAEPVSLWTQYIRHGVKTELEYQTTGSRHFEFNTGSQADGTQFATLFRFTGRHLNQSGDDLLPLGGAYARYCDAATDLWDGQGPSTNWEITGDDPNGYGLPSWWAEYADENYRGDFTPDGTITWTTKLLYHGIAIEAGEAYMRDLAKGSYMDESGYPVIGDGNYLQIADEDANGIPDWWAEIYGIRGESGLADHDNDGLPNYVEYLLSEIFQFNVQFDPTVADSVQAGIPDYFYRPAGCQLYVGEIFTDHDLVDDAWEDLYDSKYASRLAWDAFADADQDGWSNRSENRYAKAVLPIIADQQAHYETSGVEDESDGRVADYPIPTVSLTLSYIGARKDEVSKSPIVVKATRDGSLTKEFDAVFTVAGISEEKVDPQSGSTIKSGGSGKDDTNDNVGSLKRYLGKWSDRHAIGTLTPGNIKRESVLFEFAYTPSADVYEWVVRNDLGEIVAINRGTIDEYRDILRKYGSKVELTVKDSNYSVFQKAQLRPATDSTKAIWFLPETGTDFGTLDLKTGAFDVNLGVFKGQYVQNPSNATDITSLEDMTYRISYWSNMAAELPRQLYLGEAQTGYLREGKNSFIAWADLDGDGEWTIGEPYGIVRDVDVSWRGTKAEIELTDISPVTPRIDLIADDALPRVTRADVRERIESHPNLSTPTVLQWLDGNPIADRPAEGESFRGQRVRVVRWMLNDVPVFVAGADAKVVLDKTIETDVRSCLTEADFLVGNDSFDIDWNSFYDDVVLNGTVRSRIGNVTNATYLVVIGDGDVDWNDFNTSNTVYALSSVIVRKFGKTPVQPTVVAPGAEGSVVNSANPTFRWTMDCPEDEGYTAFSIQVLDGSTLVWDSGKQLAPPRNDKGQYEWSAPLYVGDKVNASKVFENKKTYTWKVAMYNAKYSNEAAYSNTGKFFMEVQTNGYEYGTANVAVRYFGPQSSYQKKNPVIRVRAYTSPDFTGLPVAAGYVADQVSVTNTTVETANSTVIGIPRGTYYLQAFIDSNGNGICDTWETQGYLCTRDGTTADYLNPTAITFDSEVGQGDLAVIYLEDADTDGDGLPDAWEYAEFGSITAKGVELLTETKAGEFVVNTNLTGALALQADANVPTAGLAGHLAGKALMSNAGVLALAMGAEIEGYDSFAAAIRGYVSPELVEDGVRITSLDLVDGKVSIKVEAETETAGSAWVKGSKELTVWCQVQWKPSLTGTDWLPLGDPFEITVGTEEAEEIDISDRVPEGDSGYFSVKVYEK